jgi:phosphoglycolate phosphatase-like HAD superfamily hydrolase
VKRVLLHQWEKGLRLHDEAYVRLLLQRECTPFDGVIEVLELLKNQGILLAVVTAKGPYTAHLTLQHLGLSTYFDCVKTGDVNAVIKAQAITSILQTWHVAPMHAAYIGDTMADMEEAQSAGVMALGACWAETTTISRTPSFTTFDTVQQFLIWLRARKIVAG